MKRLFFGSLTVGVLCTTLTASTFAGSPAATSQRAELIARLERRAEQLQWDAQATKGAGRQELEFRQRRLRKLIERIRAGEAVDPQEIDALSRRGLQ